MAKSELILLFDTKRLDGVAKQLGKAFDDFSVAGDNKHTPSMMIVSKIVWTALELDLNKLMEGKEFEGYEFVASDPEDTGPKRGQKGYNCLIFRGRPVVAIDGQNIVADRVGAND